MRANLRALTNLPILEGWLPHPLFCGCNRASQGVLWNFVTRQMNHSLRW